MNLTPVESLLSGRTEKVYRGTSARGVPPERTWARIRPLLEPCGITRVANVTGLDRVGLPVYQAIRPNSRSLSVSQGKGADAMGARVSAAMEAIELFFAERPPCLLRRGTFDELRREALAADPEQLPRTHAYDVRERMLWARGYDLVSGRPIWVPFDLVHIDLTEPAGEMLVSSNGLASGNSLAEAVLHGLCEVVERDAEALFNLRSPEARAAALMDLTPPVSPVVDAIVERLISTGITPVAWNLTTDIGLPAIRVFLHDAQSDGLVNPVSAPYGAGCHVDVATALVRALTESAQTRVGWIAGSRDDLSRDHYRRSQANTDYLREFLDAPKPVTLAGLPQRECESVEEDLSLVLEAVQRVGARHVIVVPLTDASTPVAVARVIVPGLEAPSRPDAQRGERAKAVLS